MSIAHNIASTLNAALGRFDIALTRKSWLDSVQGSTQPPNYSQPPPSIPAEAISYLTHKNPRLVALIEQYRDLVPSVMQPSRWTAEYQERHIAVSHFRNDNAYVFSDRNSESTYALTSYYLATLDRLNLLTGLTEDGMFGAKTFNYRQGVVVGRDLLDSITEIYSLLSHVPSSALQDATVLDIGAGYGRLAHRLTEALPYVRRVACVDAIPLSTFLCEYYLKFRDASRALAVPFPDIEMELTSNPVSLAVNIHSFSECPLAAVEWWLKLVSKHKVPYLMLVPNAANHDGLRLISQEPDGTHRDYLPILEACGYKRIALVPKYADAVIQRLGVSPTHYHFFELT